ncbi:pentatricopeptide repeat-containing protein At4g18520, chloroplastic-like [Selaginella moellendorffii]|uniref:pentatricopeptide repeat-containing protein At4g18520, chloroplastic-like n=1 Tax=Selaginella moellendorffii TaxID=88036 RepID=UPI000D1CF9A3|nr:pentatricopeptide repeat-containing protein At4g18520, chloroplastic-like [Selaginella moellendorffii]|eukprot:XP_024542713.1 pentatricopeptide repeat-containing protein At4g18520, chloroplastic-like [Selaginella moellendorffii]
MRWRAREGRAAVSKIHEWSGNALQEYDSQRRSSQAPGMAATVAALKYCARSRDIGSGRRIHCDLRQSSALSRSILLENILIDMYFKCGGVGEAWQLFQEMPHRNVVSWTSMILGSVDSGDPEVAWKLFSQMQEQGVVADARSYVAALKACSSLVSRRKPQDENGGDLLEKTKALHAQILKAGHESDVFVGSSLVDLYAKLGNLVEARHVFSKMESRDAVSWNSIISGHARFGEGELALELFEKMQEQGFKPSARTYVAAVLACSSLAVREKGTLVDGTVVKVVSLRKGCALRSQLGRDGLLSQLIVANSLIDFYVKCGSMELAREVFDKMAETSVVSWTSMITGYTHCDQGEISLQFFERMQEKGLVPDARTFVAALKACSRCADGAKEKIVLLDRSRKIYSQLKQAGHETDLFVASTLVDLFAKLGSMVDAQQVFNAVNRPDVVLWNAIISAATQCGKHELNLELFHRMHDGSVEPNARTYVAVLGACTGLVTRSEVEPEDQQQTATMLCLTKAMTIHQQLRKTGFETDSFVASSLVDLYSKCGSMPEARDVFDRMASKDVVLWNSMIRGYSQDGHGDLALKMFAKMLGDGFEPNARTYVAALSACSSLAKREVGKQTDDEFLLLKGRSIHSLLARSGQEEADVFVGSALVDMYSKCGSMDQGQVVFDRMTEHNVVSWTALIFGHALNQRGEVALDYFRRMQDEGLEPNARAYIAALKACSSLAIPMVEVDEEITSRKVAALHSEIILSGYESEVFVASSLVDAYAKLGNLRGAEQVFGKMPQRSVLAWNSIIRGYVQHGKSERALQLFAQMQDQGSRPDAATFVEAFKACGNLGVLEAGREIHHQTRAAGLESCPGVAASLVWFYGRCGSMVEAQQVFDSVKQDLVAWSSLIAGYSNQGDGKKVLDLFERMQIDQRVAPDRVIFQHVLSALSHGGQVNEAKECFRVMCSDHGIVPDAEHYACLVDVLGRANQLEEAVAMAEEIGLEPNVVFWKTILSGCSKWRNEEVARIAVEKIAALDHRGAENYVLVANTFGSSE